MALRAALFLALLAPSFAFAVGFASNDNFIVYTPAQTTAEQEKAYAKLVVARAEEFRKEFATQWLGEELPNGSGGVIINVRFSTEKDRGLTWGKSRPGRTHHFVFLNTTPELATSCTLRHEIVHAILATKWPHPNRLPEWVEEGIATRYDDPQRKAAREQIVEDWVQAGSAPSLKSLLATRDIKSFDESSYAASEALVSFLLTLGDEQTILRFADCGRHYGWDSALHSHYNITSLDELQVMWGEWLASSHAAN